MRENAASVAFATALALAGPVGSAEPVSEAGGPAEVEGGERIALFEDTAFRRGFRLAYPSSAKGHAVEKVLSGEDPAAVPAWRLCQWATRISLAGASPVRLPGGAVSYEDETKRVVHGGGAGGGPDLILDLRAGAEYGGRVRAAGEPWPHLLIEQDASRTITLDRLARLELEVDLRLASFADRMEGRADPGLHAAQFQLFFIVKEVAPGGSGDFLWFGVPFFDSRQEYPAPHRARDGGKDDATGKFIYTIDGREVLSKPLGRGERVAIRKDLLPSIREALAYAVEQRFLERGDPSRYAVVNMNLGWEMPGAYDAAVEVRGLEITAVTAGTPREPGGEESPAPASPPSGAAPTPHSQGLHGYTDDPWTRGGMGGYSLSRRTRSTDGAKGGPLRG